MKRLALVVRHGTYDSATGQIDREGTHEMEVLATRINTLVRPGEIVKMVASTAPRGQGSAAVLSRGLSGIPWESHEVLWSDYNRTLNAPKALTFVREKLADADVGIIVTHLEMTERLPGLIMGTGKRLEELRKGKAWLVNIEDGTFTCVP